MKKLNTTNKIIFILSIIAFNIFCAPLTAQTNVTVTVKPASVIRTIPTDFTGASFEMGVIDDTATTKPIHPAGNWQFQSNNTNLISLFNTAGIKSFRIGAHAIESATWSNTLRNNTTPVNTVTRDDVDKLFGFAKSAGCNVIMGINLGEGYNPSLAKNETDYILKNYASNLTAFEFGNEPDLYHDIAYNAWANGNFTYAEFQTRFQTYIDSVRKNYPTAPISGPACSWDISGYTTPFATSFNNQSINLLTHHYYAVANQAGITAAQYIEKMLSVSNQTSLKSEASTLEALSITGKMPMWKIAESNSITNGGFGGASNTMAAALWSLDYMYTLASYTHCAGVNFHFSGSGYSPFWTYSSTNSSQTYSYGVYPLYYGMLAFNQGSNGNLVSNTVNNNGLNFNAYSVVDSKNNMYVTLINKDTTTGANVTINPGATYNSGTYMELVSSGNSVSSGSVTLGGNTVSSSGLWTPTNKNIVPVSGSFTISVPKASAIILHLLPGSCSASITAVGSTTICQGFSVLLSANSGASYIWYYNGTTQVGTGATYAATQAGTYTVEVTTTGGCSSISLPITVTVNPLPSSPTVTNPVTYCQGTTATALSATGTALKWYTVSTGGTSSSTAPIPSTAAAGTTNYYVSQTVTGCEGSRATISVTINATPAAPAVTSPVTYCQNANAIALTATGTGLKWYTLATGGTSSSTAPIPSTSSSGTTNYYVSQTVTGCEGPRAIISVTINATPAAPTVISPVTYCQNANATALTATGTGLKWYTVATGGAGSSTAQTPSTTSAGTTNYYVSQTVTGCESPRAIISVIVNSLPTPSINSSLNMPICTGNSTILTTGFASSYSWLNGTVQVGSSQTYTATTIGSYTVTVTNGSGCTGTSAPMLVSISSQNCYDCANVLNGTASMDNCGVCSGGTTGILPCTTTGIIGSNLSGASIVVYPQPFEYSTKLELNNGENIESVTIYSSTGSLVYSKSGISATVIEIGESLADGLYTVIVQTAEGIFTTKIVKIK